MRRDEARQHLDHLLEIQGGLIEHYLAQNMGEYYAYLLLATPREPPANILEDRRVAYATNIRAPRAEPMVFTFAQSVRMLTAEQLLDVPSIILGGFGDAR
jgi:hypothetical protein